MNPSPFPLFTGPALDIRNATWASVDLETHALKDARIIQLGVSRYVGMRHEASRTFSINPGCPIDPGALEVHGITDEMVRHAPPFSVIASDLLVALAGLDFSSGYNVRRFDDDVLKRHFAESGLAYNPLIVDPYDFVNWRLRDLHGRSLVDMCERYRVRLSQAHDAGEDARAAGDLLCALVTAGIVPSNIYEAAAIGAVLSREADRQYQLWKHFLYVREDNVLRIGYDKRYIGTPLADMDRSFLRWALKVDTDPKRDPKWKMTPAVREIFDRVLTGQPVVLDPIELPTPPPFVQGNVIPLAERSVSTPLYVAPESSAREPLTITTVPHPPLPPVVDFQAMAEMVDKMPKMPMSPENFRTLAHMLDPKLAQSGPLPDCIDTTKPLSVTMSAPADAFEPARPAPVRADCGPFPMMLMKSPEQPKPRTEPEPSRGDACELDALGQVGFAVETLSNVLREHKLHTPETEKAVRFALQNLTELGEDAAIREGRPLDPLPEAAQSEVPTQTENPCYSCGNRVASRARAFVWMQQNGEQTPPPNIEQAPLPACQIHYGFGQQETSLSSCPAFVPLSHVWLSAASKEAGCASFKASSGQVELQLPPESADRIWIAELWAREIGKVPGIAASTVQVLAPLRFEQINPLASRPFLIQAAPQSYQLLQSLNEELFDGKADIAMKRSREGHGSVLFIVQPEQMTVTHQIALLVVAHLFARVDFAISLFTPCEWGPRAEGSAPLAVHLMVGPHAYVMTSAEQGPVLAQAIGKMGDVLPMPEQGPPGESAAQSHRADDEPQQAVDAAEEPPISEEAADFLIEQRGGITCVLGDKGAIHVAMPIDASGETELQIVSGLPPGLVPTFSPSGLFRVSFRGRTDQVYAIGVGAVDASAVACEAVGEQRALSAEPISPGWARNTYPCATGDENGPSLFELWKAALKTNIRGDAMVLDTSPIKRESVDTALPGEAG